MCLDVCVEDVGYQLQEELTSDNTTYDISIYSLTSAVLDFAKRFSGPPAIAHWWSSGPSNFVLI